MKVKHPIFLASLVSCSASSASAYSATDHSFFRSISAVLTVAVSRFSSYTPSSEAISRNRPNHSGLSVLKSSSVIFTSSAVVPSLANALSMASSSQGKYRYSVLPPYSALATQSTPGSYKYGGKVCPSYDRWNGVFSSTNSIPCSVKTPLPDRISSRPNSAYFGSSASSAGRQPLTVSRYSLPILPISLIS